MSRKPRMFGMTEKEWYAQGNPPGSFDEVIRMAEENGRTVRRRSLRAHPWDEWQVPAAETPEQPA